MHRARSLRRGELEPLANLMSQVGLAGRFSGDATVFGADPVIRSPHRLAEASCTAHLLIAAAGAAIWEARTGASTDIAMDVVHGLHHLHPTHSWGRPATPATSVPSSSRSTGSSRPATAVT
ncbi:hypothetical protein [Asanoa sp. NPDC050611]|uniref:hypothetical protein n=1 Tax=Asanoa sp. NPDC050611 TaxID=3157098 RepID=UPI0033FE3FB5